MNNQHVYPVGDYILRTGQYYLSSGDWRNPQFTNNINQAAVFSGAYLADNDFWRWAHYKAIKV